MGDVGRSRLIPVAGMASRDVEAWEELARSAREPNPFFEPEFVVPAAERLPEADGTALVVLEDEAGWTACLPVTVGRSQVGVSSVRGLRTTYSYLATPLIRAGEPPERVLDLVAAARSETGKRTFLLERYQADAPIGEALVASIDSGEELEAVCIKAERALLCRRPDGRYLDWMSKKHARDLRRRTNRLAEETETEPEVLELSSDPDAPEIFLNLEASGWKGKTGTAMLSTAESSAFFTELCRNFQKQDRLEVLALQAGEVVIAMLVNLRSGVGSYSFKIAHDENFAKFSPGIQLEVGNAKTFHASGSAWMDSCAEPDNEMINRLWPERRALRTSVLVPPDARGRMAKAAFGAAAQIRSRTKRR